MTLNERGLIQETLSAYCHRVDRGTANEVAELFAKDAVLMPYYDGKYDVHGREGVREWYTFYHRKMSETVKNLRHSIDTISIDIDTEGDVANSVCYLTAHFTMKADNVAFEARGAYFDSLVRDGERWLFRTRRIEIQYITRMGEVIESMHPMGFPEAAK
ncbi:MAG: nuclear transport factor 2 family protein [Gammaproteobacteria bacterium]